jgi:hypothetical protein
MDNRLKKIKPEARSLADINNYISQPAGIFKDFVEKYERTINIEPLLFLLEYATDHFERKERISSDEWLSPRIHASLRLYKREAADISIWEYLSLTVPEVKTYLQWRWGNEDGLIKDERRIMSKIRRHGLARLWWTAELTRNGPDYTPTVKAFSAKSQDLINYITDVDFSHNRAAAIGYVRFFVDSKIERKSKDAVIIGKTLNHVLSTIMLDHFVPTSSIDSNAYDIWIQQTPDEILMINELPKGPKEPKVPDEQIQKIINLLESIM